MTNGTRVIGCNDWRYQGRIGTVIDGGPNAAIVAFDDGVTEYVDYRNLARDPVQS